MKHRRKRYLPGGVIALFLIVGLVTWRLCCPPALYRATVLPSLGGGQTYAHTVNDHGQVAGIEYFTGEKQRLFLWDCENGIRDLGSATGDQVMINNAGQISGTMPRDPNGREAFLWEPDKGRTMLGTLGGKSSRAVAMNRSGQIIGFSRDATDSVRGFFWDKTTGMRQLNTPDGPWCEPVAINDAGQVLVIWFKRPWTSTTWLLLDPNGPIRLGAVAQRTWPLSVNSRSCIVAIERSEGPRQYLFFRNDDGAWKRLFGVSSRPQVTRLNEKNQFAYTEFIRSRWSGLRDRFFGRRFPPDDDEAVSYLWDPVRGRIALNRYIRGMCHLIVKDVNNKGCIVGSVVTKDGSARSVLLEPVPERWKR